MNEKTDKSRDKLQWTNLPWSDIFSISLSVAASLPPTSPSSSGVHLRPTSHLIGALHPRVLGGHWRRHHGKDAL